MSIRRQRDDDWRSSVRTLAGSSEGRRLIDRFIDKCNMTRFKQGLEDHKGHSAIIMAGGGNFNE